MRLLWLGVLALSAAGCPDAIPGTPPDDGGGGTAGDGGAAGGTTASAGGAAGGGAAGGASGLDAHEIVPAPGYKQFGWSVSMSDGVVPSALIGAPAEWTNDEGAGAAYVFVLRGSWQQQQKLVGTDTAYSDLFGYAVALDGDTALVGAPQHMVLSSRPGAAYVFVRVGNTWIEQAKLVPPDTTVAHHFGASVSLDGDTALVGTPFDDQQGNMAGAAYVFVRSGEQWGAPTKIVPADGSADDFFGYAVALDGDTALITARLDDEQGGNSGSAYVFVRSGNQWLLEQKLVALDGDNDDELGHSGSLSGDTAVVGSYKDDINGNASGSAYVFVRQGTTWSQQQKLIAPDGLALDWFGQAVSVLDDRILVGAPGVDNAFDINVGAVYVFDRNGAAQWLFDRKLIPDAVAEEQFGAALSQSGSFAAIGAPDFGNPDSGKVYVWSGR